MLLGVVMLSACGGNWSNRDLDFAKALPDSTMLESKLPTSAASTAPLTGVATRHDGLVVGDPSTAYADTKKAKTDYNGIIDSVLSIAGAVRKYPPSSREPNSRTWGPYTDTTNTGFEFRLVMHQVDAGYTWSLDSHKLGEAYFSIVSGAFTPTMSLTEGEGSFIVHVKDFKSALQVDAGLKALDEIAVTYATEVHPHTVSMQFTFAAGEASGYSSIGYTSREQRDSSGALEFLLKSPDTPQITALTLSSVWLAGGAGKAVGVVTTGSLAGASQTECWDSGFLVSYFKQDWVGGTTSGAATDCVDVPGL
jgi:hypothetical protein